MYKFLSFIIMLFCVLGFQDQKKTENKPMFFSMNNEWKEITNDEPVFQFIGKPQDTAYGDEIKHQLRLLSNQRGEPKLFFSEIETAVCADGECKLANIKVYWNLLGNYVGYAISPELPLTKYEHDPFEKEDYTKLHQLLLDDNSILKRRKMSDLVDKVPVSYSSFTYSNNIDAVSGATKTEIKESVVKGGLYSCYTIWHIVHGEVKEKIKEYLDSIYTDQLTNYFLNTGYRDYQEYALKVLPREEYKQYSEQITSIFKTTNALTKAYILKKIPNQVLSDQNITKELYNTFSDIGINTRTFLIKKLINAHPSAVEITSEYLHEMTKNQLKLYLDYLHHHPGFVNKSIKLNLKKASKKKNYTYSYLIKEYLKNKK